MSISSSNTRCGTAAQAGKEQGLGRSPAVGKMGGGGVLRSGCSRPGV
jgi:hypothetical protein